MSKFASAARILAAATALAPASWAGAILTSGNVQVGVHDYGNLIVGGVGITYTGVGDGISPGCYCEGWGVSAGASSAWASFDNGGFDGVSLGSFTSTASTATSVVNITSISGMTVTHAFAPASAAPGSLFEVLITIANTGAGTLNDVRYSRSMDWDIPPSTFNELVTVNRGTAANLLFSNDNGFAVPNPLVNPSAIVGGTTNVNFTDVGPADHGAFFTFGFGSLAAGSSRTFRIYYGAADSQGVALGALAAVGAEVYSLGQSNGNGATGVPATYIFGFTGVGGAPILPPPDGAVPEPATWAMMTVAGLGLAIQRRFRRS